MQHVPGNVCITYVLDLRLAVASPLMEPSTDVSQIFCAGLASLATLCGLPKYRQQGCSRAVGPHAGLACLLPAAVKLERALQMLVKAVCKSFLDTSNAICAWS